MVCRGQPTCSCCLRLGTVPAVPCQEQGKDQLAENMGTFNRGRERRDGSQAPGSMLGHTGWQEVCFPCPQPTAPQGRWACVHKLVGGVLPDESDFILMSKVYTGNLSCALLG